LLALREQRLANASEWPQETAWCGRRRELFAATRLLWAAHLFLCQQKVLVTPPQLGIGLSHSQGPCAWEQWHERLKVEPLLESMRHRSLGAHLKAHKHNIDMHITERDGVCFKERASLGRPACVVDNTGECGHLCAANGIFVETSKRCSVDWDSLERRGA
jgi:hypothetical protein